MSTQPSSQPRPPMNFQSTAMRLNSTRRTVMNYLVTGLSILATILVP